jgi:protein polybromo-1
LKIFFKYLFLFQWRKLPPIEKSVWEERANKLNEEGGQVKGSLSAGSMQDLIYECCWENCDWQFEDMADCIEHSVAEQNGHVQNFFASASSGNFLIKHTD